MNKHYFRDPRGLLRGWTEKNSNGYTYAFSANGRMLGWFIPAAGPEGTTYDAQGQIIGFGNQLTALFR